MSWHCLSYHVDCQDDVSLSLPTQAPLNLTVAVTLTHQERATRAAHIALLVMGVLVTMGASGKVLADKLQSS